MKVLPTPSTLQAAFGAALLAVLTSPHVRHALEAGMSVHMLVQYPAFMLVGALLMAAPSAALRRRLSAWNTLGISGLAAFALILAVTMIPRVLDLTLIDPRVELTKIAALVLAGAALRSSWRAAGLVVQGFFLGNVLPMTFIVGTLYQDSPLRLCNAYRLNDQQQLGCALVWVASVVALLWLARATWCASRSAAMPPSHSTRQQSAMSHPDPDTRESLSI